VLPGRIGAVFIGADISGIIHSNRKMPVGVGNIHSIMLAAKATSACSGLNNVAGNCGLICDLNIAAVTAT